MDNDLRVRAFLPDDYPMICDWAANHRRSRERMEQGWQPPPLEMLPPVSVIVYQLHQQVDDTMVLAPRDLAACWLYLARDCPACFLDHAISRPGLNFLQARDALLHCVQYLKFFAARQGYLVMTTIAGPGSGRVLERMGWFKGEANLAQYSTALFEIPAFAGTPQEVT